MISSGKRFAILYPREFAEVMVKEGHGEIGGKCWMAYYGLCVPGLPGRTFQSAIHRIRPVTEGFSTGWKAACLSKSLKPWLVTFMSVVA